jgi:peptide/nickel transport system permease protein
MVISFAIFAVVEVLPGDVAKMMLKQTATEEALHRIREELGLYRPWYQRYFEWLFGVFKGDWGVSYVMGTPVTEIVGRKIIHSLSLALFALIFGIPFAVLMGVWAGMKPDGLPDRIMTVVGMVGISLPEFVTGVLFMLIIGSWLNLLPPSSVMLPGESPWTRPEILVMPALTLTVVMFAYIMRMTRANVMDVMQSPYVRTAILKGIPMRQVIRRHVLPNSMLPTVTIIAANLGYMLGGLIIVENVFAYPGLGQLLLWAIQQRDFPLLESLVLIIAGTYAVSNLIADLSYAALDPRIRVGS